MTDRWLSNGLPFLVKCYDSIFFEYFAAMDYKRSEKGKISVSRVGIEPTTFTLKGCCSAAELPAHGHYTRVGGATQAFDGPERAPYNRTTC